MPKEILRSTDAPAPVASYSQAVRAGDFVFCSGQIPIDPATHAIERVVKAVTYHGLSVEKRGERLVARGILRDRG